MSLEPAPIERRRRRLPPPAEPMKSLLVQENLFSGLLTGSGIMASLSAAGVLQHLLPAWRLGGFPLAGLAGLLSGWMLAVPVARWCTRRLDPNRLGLVLLVAVVTGLLWVTPAAIFAPAIGWIGGALRMYIIAGVLCASGLVWGGYLNCDRLLED